MKGMEASMEWEERIAAYVDGEGSETERRRVEEAIAADPALASMAEAHAAFSAAVRRALLEPADGVDWDAMADRVLEKARVAPAREAVADERRLRWRELFGWWGRPWRLALASAACAAAVSITTWIARPADDLSQRMLLGGASEAKVLSMQAADDTGAMLVKTSGGATIIFLMAEGPNP